MVFKSFHHSLGMFKCWFSGVMLDSVLTYRCAPPPCCAVLCRVVLCGVGSRRVLNILCLPVDATDGQATRLNKQELLYRLNRKVHTGREFLPKAS